MASTRVETKDGQLVPLNPDRYHEHVELAVEGFDVSISDIESDAEITFVDGIKAEDIQKALIISASEKIYDNPDYQIPAGRLLNQQLRNIVYNQYEPLPFIDMIDKNIERGIYDGDYLFKHYTREELIEFGKHIDYKRDEFTTYTALKVDFDSYLIKQHGVQVETPQELNMLIQLFTFAKYKDKYSTEFRKYWVIKGYDILSKGRASLPTPIMKQLRTVFRKFLSCVVVPMGDTKNTIANASQAVYILVSDGAGIGLGAYDMRGLNADIDNGRMKHTGTFQVLKAFEKTTKAFTQPDRHGSTTAYYPFFHMEIEQYCVLGNAKGTVDTRIRDMDHAIMFNDFFFERYAKGEEITLFYMNDVPDLMSYMGDYDKFKEMYLHFEKTVPLEKQVKIPAHTIFTLFNDEAILQARLYSTLMDAVNKQGPFLIPIKQSNLCVTYDTKILTKEYGHTAIGKLVDGGVKETECWNGEEWSLTPLFRTSECEHVLKVFLSNGSIVEATDYHKWYVMDGYDKIVEKRTHELAYDDKLIKFDLEPVNHGDKVLKYAYENGFYTADGTVANSCTKRIRLYCAKTKLVKFFTGFKNKNYKLNVANDNSNDIINLDWKEDQLEDKFFVPSNEYTIDSRLKWLSGFVDGDGTLTNNNGTESIQMTSTNKPFLVEIMLLLQELGIKSKVVNAMDAGFRKLPLNNKTGKSGMFMCRATYRLLIAGSELNKLIALGYEGRRVIPTKRKYQREAMQFTRVILVQDEKKNVPVYCGTEPKRNKLMFNGVLTGNCLEIFVPNYPIIDLVNIKRNIMFKSEYNKTEFYRLRQEAYFHSAKDEEIIYYQKLMREHYEFKDVSLIAAVDETEAYDYFTLDGFVNLSEIGVCIIAGINMGMCKDDNELKEVSEYLIRLEDELIDYMDYSLPTVEKAAKMRRTVGIGFSDVFHMLAKHKVKYNTVEGRQLFNDKVELCSFTMMETNIQLAKDFGPCMLYRDTKYSQGITLFDTYNRNTDELLDIPSKQDWDSLKPLLLKYGVRMSTMLANAPFGTSSFRSGSQAGIEPPRGLIAKKDGMPKVVPDYGLYDEYWTTAWSDEFNNLDYMKFISVGQKWIDQGVSANKYQNLLRYPDKKVPMSVLVEETLVSRFYGNKSSYYNNIHSKNDDVSNKDGGINITVTGEKPKIDLNPKSTVVLEEDSQQCSGGGCSI